MTTMDLKGISWIDDMYDKFESMCVEVEETMYQDAVQYVENQMQTVRASVKKFYSDVMQDLLPPSSLDPVKEERPSIPAVHDVDVSVSWKSEVENEAVSVNSKAGQMVKDSATVATGDSNVNYGTCSAFCSVEEQCADESLDGQCAELDLLNPLTYTSKDSDIRQASELKSCYDVSSLNANIKENLGDLNYTEVFGDIDELLSMSKLTPVQEVKQITEGAGISEEMRKCNKSVDSVEESKAAITCERDTSVQFIETSNPPIANETVNSNAAANQGDLASIKLGESCVLVEKSEHYFERALTSEQKSYKKKIRDVFSTKRWSKDKQDEEQLAVWYGGKLLCSSLQHAQVPDSRQDEHLELEWELV